MASSSYRGNLTVGGPSLDKSKLQFRRPTPDSEVLASSDEDRDHVRPAVRPGGLAGNRRMSSGGSWLHDIQPNRKPSLPSVSFVDLQPTTPASEFPRPGSSAFAWNTSSFTASQSGARFKDVLPSPTSGFFPADRALPSPNAPEHDEGTGGIGFLLNQQQLPLRKAVRSQSYSIGQGDIEHSPVGKLSAHLRSNLRHKPSKPSLLGESAVVLSQVREDDWEKESSNGSEHGVRLPAGYWEREQKQALLKQAAKESARTRSHATAVDPPVSQQRRKTTAGLRHVSYGTTTEYALVEFDDSEASVGHENSALTRRFSEHVSVIARDRQIDIMDSPTKQQWATDNIPMLPADALGRRHSIAHYGSYGSSLHASTLSNTQEEDEDVVSPHDGRQGSQSPEEVEQFDAAAYFAGYGPASRAINASAISAAHPDPVIQNASMSGNPYAVPQVLGRPGRRLFIVTFKCSRADIYYVYDNTGLEIRCGDLVIVEGDRGCDLGQVTFADITLEEARRRKVEANDEHFRWLVMFSQYSLAGNANDSGMLGCLARANGFPNTLNREELTLGNPPDPETKPKMIKRLAQQHEIFSLRDKEGQEAKAKRLGAQKAADHKLPMEILDAEYQADHHKLTYYYYAETYVNFNELVTDLFKQYKVRIWMSAINPASVPHPGGMVQTQPPSAIGPGAIMHSGAANASSSVGPGFGSHASGSSRAPQQQVGRPRQHAPQANYDDGSYGPFAQQIPSYTRQPQAAYSTAPWVHGQQHSQAAYDRYNAYPMQGSAYPSATASDSPMNYGGYYPPTTYASSSAYSGPAYRGGAQPYVPPASSYNHPYTTVASGSGHAMYSSAHSGAGYDPSFVASMQHMSFGN